MLRYPEHAHRSRALHVTDYNRGVDHIDIRFRLADARQLRGDFAWQQIVVRVQILKPFAAREAGQVRVWCLGLGVDPLTLVTDLLTVAVFAKLPNPLPPK